MLIYEQIYPQCIIVLEKTDKRPDTELPLTINSFRLKSYQDFQRANYVVYIEDGNRMVLKDRGDGTDYQIYVDALLTNQKRDINLRKIFGLR